MSRTSKLWLAAAGGVVVLTVVIVFAFGLTPAPAFPSLYGEGAPTIEGTVAYVDYDRDQCLVVLDLTTGDAEDLFCDEWFWLEGWDDEGNLRIHFDDGRNRVNAIDPDTGELLVVGNVAGLEPEHEAALWATSHDGHAVLTYETGESKMTLIDVEGPRNYAFWQYGVTTDGAYVWASDSEDRLLVVAADGSDGPWIVAEGVNEIAWK